METISYATVINANRPDLWPCHERYSDKQVTPKARHTSHGEVPYERTIVVPNYIDNYEMTYKTCVGCTTFSRRRVLRGIVSLTLRIQIGRPETKEQTFRNFNMQTKTQATNRQWSHHIIVATDMAT